ncbi:MAG TPA: hypothetical protein VKT51_06575 [Candidatus Eremiobacteraceae bacterium]|nr:hypothetical protein [Candidatus Eremiobacteraceae bacterium]
MEQACAKQNCSCIISANSPSQFCCERCERDAHDNSHCKCGHEACGGISSITGPQGPDTLV